MRIALIAAAGILATGLAASAGRGAWIAAHSTVPALVGLTVTDAAQIVQPLQLDLEVDAQRQDDEAAVGVVLEQDPPPGRQILKESVIRLTISQGSGAVPDLHGIPVSAAVRRLEAAGLRLGSVSFTADPEAKVESVIFQSESAGTHLGPNGPVDVVVSRKPLPENVPAVPPAPAPPPAHPAAAVPKPAAAPARPASAVAPAPMTPPPLSRAPEHGHVPASPASGYGPDAPGASPPPAPDQRPQR